ncbi:ABC transporter substrate-binding protein [Paenibacillus sp. J5C_2022]|uniref:ABC transporter substrate-binding protein n=1 Tax=Paenibacillus sp. J5C2022 TaxID=2977129 RepID=UPI0021D11531|nr:ABC transporter substrate-binding protein [Paenibacillus sp. J5C2022]MCU6707853.1 ABC transporter substrate-binding protein [Paenibacillus sp. J5C2022]
MRLKFRMISILLLAVVMVFAATACGSENNATNSKGNNTDGTKTPGNKETPPKQAEIKTLTLLMFTDWYTPGWQALEAHINDNAEQVGFKLDIQKIAGGSQGEQILKTKIATDDLPDLLQNFGPGWMDMNANALDKLVDLTGLTSLQEYEEKAMDGVYKYKGSYYAVPIDTTTLMGVFYNKKVFQELNLQVPTTWTEFLQLAETVKAAGKTPIYYAGKDTWTLTFLPHFGFSQEIMRSGKSFPDFWTEMNTNKNQYKNLSLFMDSIEKSKEIIDKEYVNESYLSDTYDGAQGALVDGSAAMHANGTWFMGEIMKKYPEEVDNIGAFPFPISEDGNNYVNISPPASLSVTTSAKDVELAKQAVNYIASAEAQQIYADAQPGIYLNTKVNAKLAPAIADLDQALKNGKGILHWQGNGELYSYGAFDKFMQDYYVGGKSLEQVVEALDEETAKNAKAKGDTKWP